MYMKSTNCAPLNKVKTNAILKHLSTKVREIKPERKREFVKNKRPFYL